MAGYNRVVLVGNLTRDPEYKQLPSGQAVSRLGLAINRQFKNRQTGDTISEVCYIDVDVWGTQAENCHRYLQKGRPVLVEGRLKLDSWEDPQSGQKRNRHSVVADRVVFLASTDQVDQPSENDLNPELTAKLDQVKKSVAKKQDVKEKNAERSNAIEKLAFKDSPPFQEDLPF